MSQLILTKSISINASKAKVWEALTNPELIKKYFFDTQTETDWKVGSPIFYRGVWEGKVYEDKGTVLTNEFLKRIRYNYWSSFSGRPDVPENYAIISYELEERKGVTRLTVTQDNIENEELRKHSESNWGLVMDGMKKLVEHEM
ncbi:MAG: SRPBCC domain-containing protein [Flammeovirgaceae bacterium]|nr:SRPBCC domain-containing protein [Flammeovirgaceae bacterium]